MGLVCQLWLLIHLNIFVRGQLVNQLLQLICVTCSLLCFLNINIFFIKWDVIELGRCYLLRQWHFCWRPTHLKRVFITFEGEVCGNMNQCFILCFPECVQAWGTNGKHSWNRRREKQSQSSADTQPPTHRPWLKISRPFCILFPMLLLLARSRRTPKG